MTKNLAKVGLVGNPNSGKSTLFNRLTGLNQHVSNYPGATVEKVEGDFKLPGRQSVKAIDLPGLYSLYPNSSDEKVAVELLLNAEAQDFPELLVYVADANQLERHLLLATQIKDLGIPMIIALNQTDVLSAKGISIDKRTIEEAFLCPVVSISAKTGENIDQLLQCIADFEFEQKQKFKAFYNPNDSFKDLLKGVSDQQNRNQYAKMVLSHHAAWLKFLDDDERQSLLANNKKYELESLKAQVNETMERYSKIEKIAGKTIVSNSSEAISLTDKIDDVITHPILGLIIFVVVMTFVFQAIFAWSTYPMDWIDALFASLADAVHQISPGHWLTGLLADGVIAGLGGIVIFVPQIAILFFLISLLEESGYLSRAVYLFDGTMRRFGLNGRSIVALISGAACAIPAIMSTRTISNWKERLITIMVTPLISCSARIPVYAVLIGFVVPSETVLGVFNLQGLVFMGLYTLGILAALASALAFKFILKSDSSSYLLLELPEYKSPAFINVWVNVKEKVWSFIKEAGKIIFFISIILWFLASFGPTQQMELAESEAIEMAKAQDLDEQQLEDLIAANKIEASYAGHMGKFIEPVIRPLGFDWKIGIALITSFAAREVFVGTMATIYSIGSTEDELTIREQMAREKHYKTGKPVYTLATSLSLLIFYVFAMQCMSTLAVTKKETNSWKWPVIQFSFMTIMAYFGSLIVYQLLG